MPTALIVDDEPLARTRLRRLLESQGVEVVGEAEDAADGLQRAEELRPDMLFLDIQMPDLTGIQAAYTLLHLETAPVVVFVTGHPEYAVTAFARASCQQTGARSNRSTPLSVHFVLSTVAKLACSCRLYRTLHPAGRDSMRRLAQQTGLHSHPRARVPHLLLADPVGRVAFCAAFPPYP